MKKVLVLDTNTIIHDPFCASKFEENTVVVPWEVLCELDGLKKSSRAAGYSARAALSYLESLLQPYEVVPPEGVNANKKGGVLMFLKPQGGLSAANTDERIIERVFAASSGRGSVARLVTKDVAMRIKAKVVGVVAEDFKNDKSDKFKTYGKILVDDDYTNGILSVRYQVAGDQICKYKKKHDKTTIRRARGIKSFNIESKNAGQECAIDALLDPAIDIVALNGPAGTGKTLLALAAGLHMMMNKKLFEQLVVTRPAVPLGNDLGFLPGTVEEKMDPYMQAIYDALDILLPTPRSAQVKQQKQQKPFSREEKDVDYASYKYLVDAGLIKVEPLTYIRGRSLPKRFFLVDEAQNLRPIDVKTLVTRVGEGTKIVLTGDLSNDMSQIDNPYLDNSSNGLAHLIHRFIDEDNFCYLNLTETVRSRVAEQAARLL